MAQLIRSKGKSPVKSTAGAPSVDLAILHQRIAERAYQLFLKRDRVHGHDLDDWLQAERSILTEIGPGKRGRA